MPTNADGTMPFKQNSDLFWLSGVDQEESKEKKDVEEKPTKSKPRASSTKKEVVEVKEE